MTRQPKPSGRKLVVGGGRSEASYRRQPGRLQGVPIILIVCEGKKTEPRYFEALRNELRIRKVQIQIVPGSDGRGAPATIVKMALQKQQDLHLKFEAGDQIWCIFDTEQQGVYPDLTDVIDRATRAGLHLAISNPAFEYWYLLHFECTNRPFINATEVLEQLRNYLPQYTKSLNAFACLKDRTETALANVEALRRRADQDWDKCPNPSTGMDKLVRQMLNFSERENDSPAG